MKTFTTPAGKEIQLKIKNGTSHIQVEFSSGGQLPQEFLGVFTTEREAEIAILKYIANCKEKKTNTKEQ